MRISRIEGNVGPKALGHVQRVTTDITPRGCLRQTGETLIQGKVTYREVIEKCQGYFRRVTECFSNSGELLNGSKFIEELHGDAANKKQIRHFGVIG